MQNNKNSRFAAIPLELTALNQWVCWGLSGCEKDKRKAPVMPNGCPASTTNALTWSTFEQVVAAVDDGIAEGIGFVFSENDSYVGIDIDSGTDERLRDWLLNNLKVAYQETSPSGIGQHLIVKGSIPSSTKKPVEIYDHARYFTMTGQKIGEPISQIGNGQAVLNQVFDWLDKTHSSPSSDILSDKPVAEYGGIALNDEEIIEKALNASGSAAVIFGDKASFRQLWEADVDALSRYYPPQKLDGEYPFDHSSADLALAGHLAFYTGKHGERMDRIFRMSGLMRQKWDRKDGYNVRTINKACADAKSVYKQTSGLLQGTLVRPVGLHSEEDFIEYFNANYYVVRDHGGRCVVFNRHTDRFQLIREFIIANQDSLIEVGETTKGKIKYKNAAQHWYESPKSFKFDYREFRPDREPNFYTDASGQTVLNTWTGLPVKPEQGSWQWTEIFLRQIICGNDCEIYSYIIAWISQLVNEPHIKLGVALVLQSEQQGTGKGTFYTLLSWLLGEKHCLKTADAKAFVGDFNDAIDNKLVLCADEAFAPNEKALDGRIKALITEDSLVINAKGVARVDRPHYGRVLFLSNEPWAAHIEAKDRRYVVIEVKGCDTQCPIRWSQLRNGMRSELAAFLWHLLNEKPYTRQTMPPLLITKERSEMQVASLKGLQRVAYEILQNGELVGGLEINGEYFITNDDLRSLAKKIAGIPRLPHPKKLFGLLSSNPAILRRLGPKSRRGCFLPPLKQARTHFEKITSLKITWEDDGDWTQTVDL